MSEILATSVISGIITSILENSFKKSSVLDKINAYRRKESAKNKINGISSEYQEKFRARHGKVKFIGKSEPIDVSLVYTDIECIEGNANFQMHQNVCLWWQIDKLGEINEKTPHIKIFGKYIEQIDLFEI